MHANTATHASSDLDLNACMHADTHASIRAARLPVDSVAPQRRFTRRRHTCRWQKGQAARTLARSRPYVEASVHAARLPLDSVVPVAEGACRRGSRQRRARRRGRQAAANAAGGGSRQRRARRAANAEHARFDSRSHIDDRIGSHSSTESRSTPFARVPTSSPPAI